MRVCNRLIIAAAALAATALGGSPIGAQELSGIVTRQGDQLLENGKPFRFISFNIPNLQMVEDNYALDAKTPWRLPNQFELNDALESVRQMGRHGRADLRAQRQMRQDRHGRLRVCPRARRI